MASSEQERYILHLNHALAMESALVDYLEERSAEVRWQEARQRLLQHREETIQHREVLRKCIEELHGEPTSTKANVQSPVTPGMLGRVLAVLESEKEDRQILQSLADLSIEAYEAGVYRVLAQVARNLGFTEQAAKFDSIREEEEAMVGSIRESLPAAVQAAFPPLPRAA